MAVIKNIEDIRKKPSPGRNGGEFVIGNVHHFRVLNYRLEYGTEADRQRTRAAISRYGAWDPDKSISGEDPLPAQIALAIEERKAQHAFLKAEASREGTEKIMYQQMLAIFEYPGAGFVDDKLNYLPPLKIGITGNRRTSVYIEAMVPVLMDQERTPNGLADMNFTVPVNYPTNITQTIRVPVNGKGEVAQWVGGTYVRTDGGAVIQGGSYVGIVSTEVGKGKDKKTVEQTVNLKVDGDKIVGDDGVEVPGYSVKELTLNRFDDTEFMQKLRGEIQLRENTTVVDGFLEPSDAETLIGVRKITSNGGSQADVRRHFEESKSVRALRMWFANKLSELDIASKWGLRLFARWTAKPFLNDNPLAPKELQGKPTVEKHYTVGQGADKKDIENRKNPDFLLFSDFDQFAFQGIRENVKDAPEELKEVPVGQLAVAALDLLPDRELGKINEKRAKDGKKRLEPLTKDFMEIWLDHWTSGGKGVSKKMSEQAQKKFGGSLKNLASRMAVSAVVANDTNLAKDAELRAEGCNAMLAMNPEAYASISKSMDKLANLDAPVQLKLAEAIAALLEAETVSVPVGPQADESTATDVQASGETEESEEETAETEA